ncbi:maleylpyruvate isomerase family mycothiol-dependent enzyme [Nocardioides sp. KIGAM211]|uniref:Maleylpyruvate isomerase family mycothiol-dependent enzyme n=1 Tax=Nocardioides luti TaxID=2761101 RepID=A0A7X0RD10_9ACTN|nr:maleylpyruvate isomerase family mycothiol-dependent enzyme [Nocardioides luti]MBB6625996.1 maleylpyruvate isomerase family mycothiol-dependent enzyme [Nocardioides luti]
MTDLADRSIAALRAHHDELAALVATLDDDALAGPSGASEWTVAQVLSHLGSGAEINLGSVTGTPTDNQQVWDRWDAASPREQADGFVEHDARLVETFEAYDADERATRTVDLGFLPEPVPLVTALGMRLNEVAAHAWDVTVGIDPAATLRADSAALLAEHFSGGIGFLLGFVGKPDRLAEPATVALGDSGYAVVVDDGVRLVTEAGAPTATLEGPLEAGVRLLSGRLKPEHTPAGVDVSGNVTLAQLREVFPGY